MVNTTMRMNKTLDGRYGNRGDNPNAITQGAIVVTKMKTQDRVGNNPLSLKPPPRSTDGTTDGGRRKCRQGMGNGRKPPAGGIPGTFHTGQFPESTGNVATTTTKANTPAGQRALATTLHQFLTDGNRNLQDLNGYYKHFTAIVAVPGTYMKKFTYGHGIGAAGIIQVYPVAKNLGAILIGRRRIGTGTGHFSPKNPVGHHKDQKLYRQQDRGSDSERDTRCGVGSNGGAKCDSAKRK